MQHAPFEDAVTEKSLDKFRTGIVKRFGRRIESIDASTYKENVRFRELCAFLGLELDEDEDDRVEDGNHLVGDADRPDTPEEEEEENGPEEEPAAAADLGQGKHVVSVPFEVESGPEERCVTLHAASALYSITPM